ncbi:hypothetical protein [uncultured Fibrobacter sp.]|uniref:hypothetical protein n=1 Tax=uncultured Fibrobacter sp. TaxID=261512 RepID=UPI0025F0CFE1|nr:hypothetical protein [uncultured Fibrobacter sp.]
MSDFINADVDIGKFNTIIAIMRRCCLIEALYEQRENKKMYVDEKFFGTIIAPASHVILGQANKTFYGSVMANNISVHQYADIYYVKFNPTTMMYSFNF